MKSVVVKSLAGLSCAVVVALGLSGCGTPTETSGEPLKIKMSENGALSIGGTQTDLKSLPSRLKAAGATPRTAILVLVPPNMPMAKLEPVSKALSAAGFKKHMFTRPRRALAVQGSASER